MYLSSVVTLLSCNIYTWASPCCKGSRIMKPWRCSLSRCLKVFVLLCLSCMRFLLVSTCWQLSSCTFSIGPPTHSKSQLSFTLTAYNAKLTSSQHQSISIVLAVLQPCFIFVGEGFENNPELRMAKSLLLDFFRGRQIDAINLKVPLCDGMAE